MIERIVKTIIVDDHKIFRTGLEIILNGIDYVKVVGQAANATQLASLLKRTQVDLIFMDIKMPDTDGIELTQAVLAKNPDIKVIALSMFGEIQYFNKMIESGASGFLLKHTQEDELSNAIEAVMQGGNYFSKEFMAGAKAQELFAPIKSDVKLSKREQEILELICDGFSNPEIAKHLTISAHTVDGHRRNLFAKLEVKNTAALVVFALKHGLVKA